MLSTELQTVLAQQPLGLVFDIDGTLSPIAPTPDAARLYPGVAALLEQARQHAHIAILTGRGIENGAEMVNVEGITYVGTHGLEWSDGLPTTHPISLVPEAEAYIEPGKRLLDRAEQHFANRNDIVVQRKRVGGSIHYRLADDAEQARQDILNLLSEPAQQLHMRLGEGKRVIEVLSPLTINKGEALRLFIERYALQGVVFAGDDRTDLYAIHEIAALRQQGVMALSIVVRHADTLPELLAHATIGVNGVPEMAHLLHEMVHLLDMQKR